LKDEEPISSYKILVCYLLLARSDTADSQNGNTIHMVKGSVKAPEAPAAAPPLPQMGTGLNVSGNPVDNIENIPHVSRHSHQSVVHN
jgi:ubiquilin